MLCFAQSLLKSNAASVMYSLKVARVYGQIECLFDGLECLFASQEPKRESPWKAYWVKAELLYKIFA